MELKDYLKYKLEETKSTEITGHKVNLWVDTYAIMSDLESEFNSFNNWLESNKTKSEINKNQENDTDRLFRVGDKVRIVDNGNKRILIKNGDICEIINHKRGVNGTEYRCKKIDTDIFYYFPEYDIEKV